MDQNSGLKAPKKLACLLVKKCGNNGQELGNFKLITLYIRKRRPINFTLDDLENDEQDEAFDYQNMDLMPSTSRALPSRICMKKILYDDKGN